VGFSRLFNDLACDTVLTRQQVMLYSGCSLKDIKGRGVYTRPFYLGKTRYSRIHRRVVFVTCDEQVLRRQGSALRHLAGVAALRYSLKAKPEAWHLIGVERRGGNRPDATWKIYGEEAAIDFDAGAYTEGQLKTKATAYRAYDRQVWGVTTASRKAFLEAAFSDIPGVEVRVVDWLPS
jgi:hypothetical protein